MGLESKNKELEEKVAELEEEVSRLQEQNESMGDSDGGVLFIGDKGVLMCGCYGRGPRLIPETDMRAYKKPEPTLPRVPDSHEMDWIRACKSGKPAGSNFDYAGPFTEAVDTGIDNRRAGLNPRQAIRQRQAEIVMAMQVHGHIETFHDGADEVFHSFRVHAPGGIGTPDVGRAGFDGGLIGLQ